MNAPPVSFEAGEQLAQQGHYEEALDHYTEALVLARDRTPYVLAFARALVEDKGTREAETYLMEVIESDPASGVANLMVARINADRKDMDAAVGYYQRAIYGLWPEAGPQQRINVRFELIDLLCGKANTRKCRRSCFARRMTSPTIRS